MAILQLVRCDQCAKDTWLESRPNQHAMQVSGGTFISTDYVVPAKIKQVDGRHFCSWACVATYAADQAKPLDRDGVGTEG